MSFPIGAQVVRNVAGADEAELTVWTVRSFDPATGFYNVTGNIGGSWPTNRAFLEHEIRLAGTLEERLVRGIYGDPEEVITLTPEELRVALEAEGLDAEAMSARLRRRLAAIRGQ